MDVFIDDCHCILPRMGSNPLYTKMAMIASTCRSFAREPVQNLIRIIRAELVVTLCVPQQAAMLLFFLLQHLLQHT